MDKTNDLLGKAIMELEPKRGIRSKIWNKMIDHFYLTLFGFLAFIFILAYFA